MAEMSREEAAKRLLRTAVEDSLWIPETIAALRMGAEALRRLDELEKYLVHGVRVQEIELEACIEDYRVGLKDAYVEVLDFISGDMQMPPEDTHDPTTSIIAKLKENQEHFTQEEQDIITKVMEKPEEPDIAKAIATCEKMLAKWCEVKAERAGGIQWWDLMVDDEDMEAVERLIAEVEAK